MNILSGGVLRYRLGGGFYGGSRGSGYIVRGLGLPFLHAIVLRALLKSCVCLSCVVVVQRELLCPDIFVFRDASEMGLLWASHPVRVRVCDSAACISSFTVIEPYKTKDDTRRHDKTKQNETRQDDKARPDQTRQDKTRQNNPRMMMRSRMRRTWLRII